MNAKECQILTDFLWTKKRVQAAMALAEGLIINEASKQAGVSE